MSLLGLSFEKLLQVKQALCLDVSQKKLFESGTVGVCLGIEINTKEVTIIIPPEKKMNQICVMDKAWSKKNLFHMVTSVST